MIKDKSLWKGRIGISIPTFIETYSTTIRRFHFGVITSVDSDTDLLNSPFVARELGGIMLPCESCGSGILIPVEACVDDPHVLGIFHGFDEIWFFDHVPSLPSTPMFSIVAPLEIDHEAPEGLAQWMESAGCKLGLGDGNGLNYATTEEQVALELMSNPAHI